MLAHLACALYWFNPLVWVAARRLRIERELACDDCALEVGMWASDYANYGVKPEDAQTLKALGFDNVSLRDLTRARMFGVTESYVKELRGLGFDKLTLEQVIRLKQFGVDAEYIRKLRAAGFKNISSNDLLKLKAHGLDAILLKN
jgi:hypothetical protein